MEENRRNYTRVQDILPLTYQRVSPEDYPEIKAVFPAGADMAHRFPGANLFGDLSFENVLAEVEKGNPFLAALFQHLDRKLDRVLDLLRALYQERRLVDHQPTTVELSGSGMRLQTEESFQTGDILRIQLYLAGNVHSPIIFYARVIRVEGDPPAPYGLFLEYDLIQEDDREQIIRYIFFKQREQLKARKKDSTLSLPDEPN